MADIWRGEDIWDNMKQGVKDKEPKAKAGVNQLIMQ